MQREGGLMVLNYLVLWGKLGQSVYTHGCIKKEESRIVKGFKNWPVIPIVPNWWLCVSNTLWEVIPPAQ